MRACVWNLCRSSAITGVYHRISLPRTAEVAYPPSLLPSAIRDPFARSLLFALVRIVFKPPRGMVCYAAARFWHSGLVWAGSGSVRIVCGDKAGGRMVLPPLHY